MRGAFALAIASLALVSCGDEFAKEKDLVRHGLRDPESATFRDVQRCGRSHIVSGELNTANEFGGMTGFQPFYVDGARVGIMGAADDSFVTIAGRCTRAIEQETKRIRAGLQQTSS